MMNEPHGSGNDDIYDNLDTLLNPEPVCSTNSRRKESSQFSEFTKTDNTTIDVPSPIPSASNFALNEDQLKKEEMILYLDLVVTEMDHKKTLLNINAEYIKLKEEVDSLRKSLSEKEEKIYQLTAENTTLKKNICSLYKTAKSEIEQKDAMLQEANKKIDKMHFRKSTFQVEHSVESSQCEPSTSGISSPNFTLHEDNFNGKESLIHKNDRKRNYEASESFSSPSTSSNSHEHKSKWNRFDVKHGSSYYKSEKHNHVSSHETTNKKGNTYNYTDRKKNINNSKNNELKQRNEKSHKRLRHES